MLCNTGFMTLGNKKKKSPDSLNNYLDSNKTIPYYARDLKEKSFTLVINEILNHVADI